MSEDIETNSHKNNQQLSQQNIRLIALQTLQQDIALFRTLATSTLHFLVPRGMSTLDFILCLYGEYMFKKRVILFRYKHALAKEMHYYQVFLRAIKNRGS